MDVERNTVVAVGTTLSSNPRMGGIREFKFLQEYTAPLSKDDKSGLLQAGHQQQEYTPELKAYYRFNGFSTDS
jgi:hypothetical protein